MVGIPRPARMNIVDFRNLRQAAVDLGRDGILNDPTDTEMFVAAAELAELLAGQKPGSIDLDLLDEYDRRDIIDHYDKATGL